MTPKCEDEHVSWSERNWNPWMKVMVYRISPWEALGFLSAIHYFLFIFVKILLLFLKEIE